MVLGQRPSSLAFSPAGGEPLAVAEPPVAGGEPADCGEFAAAAPQMRSAAATTRDHLANILNTLLPAHAQAASMPRTPPG